MTPHEIDYSLQGLTLSVRSQNGYTIAAISGDLDIASVPALRLQLLGLLRPDASRMVADLSGVTFCDASGLAVLIGVSRRARLLGGVLRLAAPSPPVVTVLRLTGLDRQFEIFATGPAATSVPARLSVPDGGPHPPRRTAAAERSRPENHEAERSVLRAPGRLSPGPACDTLGDARSARSGVAMRARRSSVAR
jgi:anti-sigma B factor antagonist